jgi:mannose-6-phosphate isomerase-like protein (cupin superfamily)
MVGCAKQTGVWRAHGEPQTRKKKETRMKTKVMMIVLAAALAMAATAAIGGEKTMVVSNADLVWKDMGIPGVQSAVVTGDMAKGPCRFFLKYPVGLVTPAHHHSPDHYGTIVSGTMLLTVDGKETKLEAGSFFALTNKAVHVAKVVGDQPVVMFIQADGPWDVVMEKQ